MWGGCRGGAARARYLASIVGLALYPLVYGLYGARLISSECSWPRGVQRGTEPFAAQPDAAGREPSDSANGIAVFYMLINATGVIGPPLAAEFISRYGVFSALVLSTIMRIAGCAAYLAAVGPGETVRQLRSVGKALNVTARRRRAPAKAAREVL